MSGSSPSRDDDTTPRTARGCPVCKAVFVPAGRQVYCQPSCRKTAHRRRHHHQPLITVPAGRPRRHQTVYQCPDCDSLQLGVQRCADCGTFGRSTGLGGTCPHCEEPVTLHDLGLIEQL